jgi:hypothetical protein
MESQKHRAGFALTGQGEAEALGIRNRGFFEAS